MKITFPNALFMFCFLLLGGCTTSRSITESGEDYIPADFKPRATVLLIERLDNSSVNQQAKVEAYMKETYPYPYRFINTTDIEDQKGKYANTDSFRYVLIGSFKISNRLGTLGPYTTRSQLEAGPYHYHFYDRKMGKNYPPTQKTNEVIIQAFRYTIKTILENTKER